MTMGPATVLLGLATIGPGPAILVPIGFGVPMAVAVGTLANQRGRPKFPSVATHVARGLPEGATPALLVPGMSGSGIESS